MQAAWLLLGMIFVAAMLLSSHQVASVVEHTPGPSHTAEDVPPTGK